MALSETGAIIILGASGQIGRALVRACGQAHIRAIALKRPDADLSRIETLLSRLDETAEAQPVTALINAAAYTQVDGAEKEPVLAAQINAQAPAALARWSAKRDIPFIHYSTDYVFPGTGDRPWTEKDPTSPVNTYGKTKLAGEHGVVEAAAGTARKHLIFRTAWVYDADGSNFLNTMLRLGHERDTLSVVNDQIGAPSFADDLAQATLRALKTALRASPSAFPSGIYHLTNSGETSWHGFAEAIFSEARGRGIPLKIQELRAVPSAEYPMPAARPKNSRLSNALFSKTFGFALRPWREALHECLQEKASQGKL